jgi:hypothetical protein
MFIHSSTFLILLRAIYDTYWAWRPKRWLKFFSEGSKFKAVSVSMAKLLRTKVIL